MWEAKSVLTRLLAPYTHVYRHMCRHVYRHVDRHVYRHVHGHVHRHVHRLVHRHENRHVLQHDYRTMISRQSADASTRPEVLCMDMCVGKPACSQATEWARRVSEGCSIGGPLASAAFAPPVAMYVHICVDTCVDMCWADATGKLFERQFKTLSASPRAWPGHAIGAAYLIHDYIRVIVAICCLRC